MKQLIGLLGFLLLTLPCAAQPVGKVSIAGVTNEHIEGEKYRPLPNVRIFVSREGAGVRNPNAAKGESGWRSDKSGTFSIEIPSGEPVTIVFLYGDKHMPQVERLSAVAGAEYRVSPASTTVANYSARAAKNPLLPPPRTLLRLAARSLPADLEAAEAKRFKQDFETLLKAIPSQTSLLIPLYIYPSTPQGKKEWLRLNAAANLVPITVIVNPENGPGADIQVPVYRSVFQSARKGGISLLAYIYTQRGTRPLAQVEADIVRWKKQYGPYLSGVFIDEQASDDMNVPYYQKLSVSIRKTFPSAAFQIIGNPGCPFDEAYLAGRVNDATCFHEGREAKNWDDLKVPAFMERHGMHRGVILRYKITDKADAFTLLKRMVREEVRYVYLTDAHMRPDGVEDPWHRLPSYWDELVETLAEANRQIDRESLPKN